MRNSCQTLSFLRASCFLVMACMAAQDSVASSCSTETLSSILLSPEVPVDLFSNPKGGPLTLEEVDEVHASIGKIRASLGTISSLTRVRSPFVPRSLDITVGANAKATGYSFSPKDYSAETQKAGNVLVTFGTDPRADHCKVFWIRVSIPVDNLKREERQAL